MAKTKTKRPKQQHFEGMEPPRVPKIEKLADTYVDRRNERMAMLESEIAARDLLFAAMKQEGLPRYEYDGSVIEMETTEKVKVRKKSDKTEEGEGEGGDE